MNPIQSFFASVDQNAKMPGDSFLPNLEPGTHKVAISRYGVKPSSKNNGKIIAEVDFVIVSSTVHQPGDQRGLSFHPGTDQYGLSEGRTKDFILKVGQCLGDQRDWTMIGADMASPAQKARGIVLNVVTTQVYDKSGQPKIGKNGRPTRNNTFTSIQQTMEEIVAMRAKVDAVAPMQAVQAIQVQPPAQPPQNAWGQPPAGPPQNQWGQQPQAPAPQNQWGQQPPGPPQNAWGQPPAQPPQNPWGQPPAGPPQGGGGWSGPQGGQGGQNGGGGTGW